MKPIILTQRGSRWSVSVDFEACRRFHAKPAGDLAAFMRDGVPSVTVSKVRGGFKLSPTAAPAFFSKSEAEGYAHQIGHYGLGLGSFAYTYTEERREPKPARDATRRKARRRR